MSKEELGTLVIVVLKARNLIDKYFWKQDVFAQVKLNGDAKRTQVDVKGGQTPEWDEEIRVPILKDAHERNRKLEVSCWAKEPRKEDNIGTGIVDLTETLKTGEFDDWVRLDVSGVVRGEIYLEMTFFANAPAPAPAGRGGGALAVPNAGGNLQRRPSKLSPAERLSRPQQREHLPLLTQPKTQPPSASANASSNANANVNANTNTNGRSPPSSGHSSPSRRGRESPLPPLPEYGQSAAANAALPSALTAGRPGASPRPPGSLAPHPHTQGGLTPHVPSVLRPRNPKSSPTPIPGPRVEYSGVIPSPDQDYDYAPESTTPPRTYTPVVPPPGVSRAPSQPQLHLWDSDDGPTDLSFPVPSLGAREPSVDYSSAVHSPPPPTNHAYPNSNGSTPPLYPPQTQPPYPPQHQPSFPPQYQPSFTPQPPPSFQQPPAFQQLPPSFQQSSFQPPPPPFTPPGAYPQQPPAHRKEDLPDPYLLARYQSPLPLPPDAGNESHVRQHTTSTSTPHGPPAPASAPAHQQQAKPAQQQQAKPAQQQQAKPAQQQQPASAWQTNPDNARVQALKHVEDEAKRRRDQERRDRDFARKAAEEEEKRKSQEERDMELARQLDRELNLGVVEVPAAGAGRSAGMPGQW